MQSYERLKRADVRELLNLHGLGRSLVALRIARGLTQRQLAGRLGIHESQVSCDERNEYHGIIVERANPSLDAMGVQLRSRFEGAVVGCLYRAFRNCLRNVVGANHHSPEPQSRPLQYLRVAIQEMWAPVS